MSRHTTQHTHNKPTSLCSVTVLSKTAEKKKSLWKFKRIFWLACILWGKTENLDGCIWSTFLARRMNYMSHSQAQRRRLLILGYIWQDTKFCCNDFNIYVNLLTAKSVPIRFLSPAQVQVRHSRVCMGQASAFKWWTVTVGLWFGIFCGYRYEFFFPSRPLWTSLLLVLFCKLGLNYLPNVTSQLINNIYFPSYDVYCQNEHDILSPQQIIF